MRVLSVLPSVISEELFKQKIGTGDRLEQMLRDGDIKKEGQYIQISKGFLEKQNIKLTEHERELLHLDIIKTFYAPKLENAEIIDYNDFIKYSDLYINLSYHYQQISKIDDALCQITPIAKKMQYWGKKELLVEILNSLDDEELSEDKGFLKAYFLLFSQMLSFNLNSNAIEDMKNKFIFLEKAKHRNFLIYLETKNLEGIFKRIFEKSPEKAIKVHNETINLIKKDEINGERINAICGKIFENLSFSYQQIDEKEEAEKNMEKAEEYLKKSGDPYELAKMYFYKVLFKYNSEPKEFSWIPCLEQFNESLKGYRFPDIERNKYNMLSRIEIEIRGNFENYFKFKSRVLNCDLVLYQDYFVTDFISIYNTILKNKDKYKKEIARGLNDIIDVLQGTNLEDEKLFIEMMTAYFNGEEYSRIKNEIKNQSLIGLFDKLVI